MPSGMNPYSGFTVRRHLAEAALSIEQPTEVQLNIGRPVSFQEAPESHERRTGPRAWPEKGIGAAPAAPILFVPSLEPATAYQLVLRTSTAVHMVPES